LNRKKIIILKLFKEIKFRNVILFSYIIFSILATFVIIFSALDSYRTNKLYHTKSDLAKISMDYVYIDKYQDFILIENKDVFWGSQLNYEALKYKINSTVLFIDSIIINDKLTKGDLFNNLEKLKQSILNYKKIIEEVASVNKELYDPIMGIQAKNQFLQSTIYNEEQFKTLNLLVYFDKLLDYSTKLSQNQISKKEYQKKYNYLYEKLYLADITQENKYYILLFQDRFSDYYNNSLLEYSKLRSIGFNYSEGLMKAVDTRKNDIKKTLDRLNYSVDTKFKRNYISFLFYYLAIFVIINLLVFAVFYYIYRIIYSPWKKIQDYLLNISKSESHEIIDNVNVVELNMILNTFNKYVNNLEEKENLIIELSKGNYSYEYTPDQDDGLGVAIGNLRNELLKSEKEAVKFQETEEQQKWTTNGIAKIGAVMRQFTNDINALSKNILEEIIEYVNAIQGALYLYDKENEVLKLSTYYSYGKQRIKKKEIKPYEGVLGIVLVEKREYYFSDMPDDYMFFETGMGHAKPKSLFVFPLLFENEIFGIIELASLIDFEDYVKDFCLSLANEIAITISYTQINVQTNILLKQSESHAKDLVSNEKLYKKNQDNLKSLIRMAEQKYTVKEDDLLYKEGLLRQKVADIISLEKEISDKEEYIETMVNEYENMKSSLENQNNELRKRIEDLEKRLRDNEE